MQNFPPLSFKRRAMSGSRHSLLGGALLVLTLYSPAAVHAIANCSVSASGVAFGSYTFLSPGPTDATGNVQVSCSLAGLVSLLVSYDIALSQGGGTYAMRQLTNGPYSLNYNLYTDTAYTTVWGDGSGATSTVSDGYLLGLLTVVRDYPVYGRMSAGQNVPVGFYNDIITVTVTY